MSRSDSGRIMQAEDFYRNPRDANTDPAIGKHIDATGSAPTFQRQQESRPDMGDAVAIWNPFGAFHEAFIHLNPSTRHISESLQREAGLPE